MPSLDAGALAQLFLDARTPKKWVKSEFSADQLHELYDLVRMGPTSNNASPARFTFATSPAARAKLLPAIHAGNHNKVDNAALICVISYDAAFFRHWQILSPHKNLNQVFDGRAEAATEDGYRSAVLQAGYLIIAARALGFDAFPLTGFDADKVPVDLLEPGWKPFMLCCLGRADDGATKPRAARLTFEQACRVL